MTPAQLGDYLGRIFVDAEATIVQQQGEDDDETKVVLDELKIEVLHALQAATRNVLL